MTEVPEVPEVPAVTIIKGHGDEKPPEVGVQEVTREYLASVTGRTFFNLGPVYVLTHTPFDLLTRYQQECQTQLDVINYRTDKPMFDGLDSWNDIIQSVPDAQWPGLLKFLDSLSLKRQGKRQYWRLYTNDVTIVFSMQKRIFVQLSLPSGNKWQAAAALSDNGQQWQVSAGMLPSKEIVEEADRVLDALKQQQN